MKFAFKYALLPKQSGKMLREVDEAAARLATKLARLKVNQLKISDYNKRYFGGTLQNITAALQLRTYLLGWALKDISLPKKEIVLVDYGGGSGMLSLLAKEYGIGTVIYDDIYDVSCKDAEIIGEAIGNKADHYVHGDIDDLIQFVKQRRLNCTTLVSYDVLEHIYNVPAFLQQLPSLSEGVLSIVMGSGANMKNPFVNRVLVKKQIQLETMDREPNWGAKDRDALKSYLGIRKEMINAYLKEKNADLPAPIVDDIARRTRGLVKSDIERSVQVYLDKQELPQPLVHPTNTCDPNNGNWAEHLMNTKNLAKDLSNAGFESAILCGYYGDSNHTLKRLVGRCLNAIISVAGKQGLFFAGFFILYGIKRPALSSSAKSAATFVANAQ
jgi:hypothetical protein